jgi:NAD(P)-dependent dehydrogenase (short-subunit alcohol dehydrogenase family)
MNALQKTILITGINRGIGKALAQKFLAEGHSVIGTSQTGGIDFAHDNLKAFQLDLAAPESIDALCTILDQTATSIDLIVNNAGVIVDEDETHVVIDKLRKTLEVNLIGTIDLTEHLLPLIRKGGHIVNISSSAGSLTDSDFDTTSHHPFHYPSYKISKVALNMFTRTLAMNLKHEQRDITVSSVHPGWVRTDMGGGGAPMLPAEAAEWIYKLAISKPETGCFWFKGEKYPW